MLMIDTILGLVAAWSLLGICAAILAFATYSKEEYLDVGVGEAVLYYGPIASPLFLLVRFTFFKK
jgi:hypothetical protein